MNAAAGESLTRARLDLDEAVATLRSRLSGDELAAFEVSQAAWEQYCHSWAEFDAMEVKGGTMWSAVRSASEEALVRERTEVLQADRRVGD